MCERSGLAHGNSPPGRCRGYRGYRGHEGKRALPSPAKDRPCGNGSARADRCQRPGDEPCACPLGAHPARLGRGHMTLTVERLIPTFEQAHVSDVGALARTSSWPSARARPSRPGRDADIPSFVDVHSEDVDREPEQPSMTAASPPDRRADPCLEGSLIAMVGPSGAVSSLADKGLRLPRTLGTSGLGRRRRSSNSQAR